MFSGVANFAFDVDKTFLIIISIALFILLGITVTMIVFAFRYNRKRHPIAVQFKDNLLLEIVWTVVPLIIVLLLFYYGYKAFIPERKIPKDPIPIKHKRERCTGLDYSYVDNCRKTWQDLYKSEHIVILDGQEHKKYFRIHQ